MKINLKNKFPQIIIAAFFSFNLSAALYFYFIQTELISKKQLFLAGVIWVLLTLAFLVKLSYWLKSKAAQLPGKTLINLGILSLVIGILWSFSVFPRQENIFLLPTHTVTISSNPDSSRLSTITWFGTDFGSASYDQFSKITGWQREGSQFIQTENPASFIWQGKPGTSITFRFPSETQTEQILFDWGDGSSQQIDPALTTENGEIILTHPYTIPWISAASVWLFAGLSTAFILFLILTLWFAWQPQSIKIKQHWLWFVIPPLIVWGFVLLAYFPAVLTPDSLAHWRQIHTGVYDDWHSVFYSVLLWLLTRIVDQPWIIPLTQIIALSLSIAWGLGELQNWGVRRGYLWGITLLTAFAFQIMLTVISVWKDVPYSICIFLFFVQILKLVRTKGAWLNHKSHLIGLILTLCGVLLFRKNGLFVVYISLILLALLYRKFWKPVLITGVITLMLTQGFTFFSTRLLDVFINSGKGTSILLHHIIAHVDHGTPMNEAQLAHLDHILPLDQWVYQCGTVDTVMWNANTDRTYYAETLDQTTDLFFDLLKKDPWVDVQHQICASELVWRLIPSTYTFTNKFDHIGRLDEYRWITKNDMGLKEESKLPGLNRKMMDYFFWLEGNYNLIYVVTWRPAFYLYLSLLSIGLLAWKRKRWILLLPAAPVLLQSGTLMAINLAQDFRYQFSIVLIGFLCLGLWFIPQPENKED